MKQARAKLHSNLRSHFIIEKLSKPTKKVPKSIPKTKRRPKTCRCRFSLNTFFLGFKKILGFDDACTPSPQHCCWPTWDKMRARCAFWKMLKIFWLETNKVKIFFATFPSKARINFWLAIFLTHTLHRAQLLTILRRLVENKKELA